MYFLRYFVFFLFVISTGAFAANSSANEQRIKIIPKSTQAKKRIIPQQNQQNIVTTDDAPPSYDRIKDGHTFLRNNVTAYAFISPYINSSLEAAYATLNITGATHPIKSVGLSPSINGQFRIEDFGVELSAQMAEIFGANSYSAYVLGAALDYGFSAALKYALFQDSSWIITPSFFYSYNKGLNFSPLDVVNRSVNSPTLAITQNIIQKSTTRQLRPSLLAAYAVSPLLGLSTELGMGFLSLTDAPKTKAIRIGAAFDFNFKPDTGIPLGSAVFFRNDIPWRSPEQTSTPILGAGLYEMINSNFNFGIEVARLMKSASSISVLLGLTAYY